MSGLSPGMQRLRREMPHIVVVSVSLPLRYKIEDLVSIAFKFTQWLEERNVLIGDFMVDRSRSRHAGEMSWTYRFRDARIAMMFKLTFGGV